MATLLDETLIADTLASLPGWKGDSSSLRREVDLSPDQLQELRRQVDVDATAMGHLPTIDGNVIVLTTADAGGVTELDIVMASHISDLVHRLSDSEPGVEADNSDASLAIIRSAQAEDQLDDGAGGEPELPRTNTAMLES